MSSDFSKVTPLILEKTQITLPLSLAAEFPSFFETLRTTSICVTHYRENEDQA